MFVSITGFIYLTPFVPLSLKGEGEENKKERRSLSWTLLVTGKRYRNN
jgi:hypothetical protein